MFRDLAWPDYSSIVSVWQAAGRDVLIEDEIREVFSHGPELMIVAQLHSEVVGVILGTFDGRRGWIHRLAVAPTYAVPG